MKTRERMIEVLESVNGPPVHRHFEDLHFGLAAAFIRKNEPAVTALLQVMERFQASHVSPHIRDLAAEALQYLREPANG